MDNKRNYNLILNEDLEEVNGNEPFKVQEIDKEGNKLDQFVTFASADDAIAFAKTLETPAEVIKTSLEESLNEGEEIIWTNLDTLEEALSRDSMISELKKMGKNYNFSKYSDAQIYRMYEREINKAAKVERDDEPIADIIKRCEKCKHTLTDAGECPVCDLGDEEERMSHTLYDIEEAVSYPNGVEVEPTSVDLDKALDFMYGLDRLDNSEYTEEEQQRAINYWIKKTDPSPYEEAKKSECDSKLILNEDDEDILLEDRFTRKLNRADKSTNKEIDKKANPKNIQKILFSTYKDKDNSYLIDGKWVSGTDIQPTLRQAIETLGTYKGSLASAQLDDSIIKVIDAVVRNKDGYIIRRGLELLKNGTVPFSAIRKDLLKIKPGMAAKDVIGVRAATSDNEEAKEPAKEEPKAETPKAEEPKETSSETPATNEQPKEENEEKASAPEAAEASAAPEWINPQSIKATITLLAKRKNGNASYYDAEGNLIDYKKITPENLDSVYIDKNKEKSFMQAMEEVKQGLAKRKNAAIKSASLFGESYDDSMEYDEYEEVELDEAMTKEESDELFRLANEVGINRIKDADRFVGEYRLPNESTLDTLRRYKHSIDTDTDLVGYDDYLDRERVNGDDDYQDASIEDFGAYNI